MPHLIYIILKSLNWFFICYSGQVQNFLFSNYFYFFDEIFRVVTPTVFQIWFDHSKDLIKEIKNNEWNSRELENKKLPNIHDEPTSKVKEMHACISIAPPNFNNVKQFYLHL